MAAKRTSEVIPLCHPLFLTRVQVEFQLSLEDQSVICTVITETHEKTGVEIEALNAVSAGLLTIYDMCKAASKATKITNIGLVKKSGGKSGDYLT